MSRFSPRPVGMHDTYQAYSIQAVYIHTIPDKSHRSPTKNILMPFREHPSPLDLLNQPPKPPFLTPPFLENPQPPGPGSRERRLLSELNPQSGNEERGS